MDYLICSSPRVGSNLLSSFLTHTGVCGTPREYLCPHEIATHGPDLCGISDVEAVPHGYARYYAAAREAFTSDGRFGVKSHLHQLRWALERGFDFEGNMPERFIHLTRADVVGQAISFARAAQTGAWLSAKDERAEPRFDAALIQKALRTIAGENEGWERIFVGYGVEPYRLSYEALTADFEGEIAGVLRFLDVDVDAIDLGAVVATATSYFKKQRDDTSARWRAQWNEQVRAWAAERPAGAALRQARGETQAAAAA